MARTPPALHTALQQLGLNDEEFARVVVALTGVVLHRVEVHRLRTLRREIRKISVEKALAMLRAIQKLGLREMTLDELIGQSRPPPPQKVRGAA